MKLLLMLSLLLAQTPFSYGYMPSPTTLYADPECSVAITTLPQTYFVIILGENEGVYHVSYRDVSGYATGIEAVDYEPKTKHAQSSFTTCNDGYPVKLRLYPSADSEVLCEIPDGEGGYYYGDASGSPLIEQVGDKWYYVSYGKQPTLGYVYSSQVSVSEFSPNVVEKIEREESEEASSPLSDDTDFVLIALLCVPAVLIIYLAFRDKTRSSRYAE
ncbi:MAG: hypothetical protein IKC48_00140 [Clostridia bacterium]|nr:hypothetical protein [Clostridia bacterium]